MFRYTMTQIWGFLFHEILRGARDIWHHLLLVVIASDLANGLQLCKGTLSAAILSTSDAVRDDFRGKSYIVYFS